MEGTSTFFVNGKLHTGLWETDALAAVIHGAIDHQVVTRRISGRSKRRLDPRSRITV